MLGWNRIRAVWREWRLALPHCAEPGCKLDAWWKLGTQHGGIELQGRWYCSPQCFEPAAQRTFQRAVGSVVPTPRAQHRIPLGLLMLSRGQLDNTQLRAALEAQQARGEGRLGQWLEKLGYASESQITSALGLQWACPVIPPMAASDLDCTRLVPLGLLQQFRMLPVHFSRPRQLMHVAFAEAVDYTALYAIGQMLDCRTEACVISSSTMTRVLEAIGHRRRFGEVRFEGWKDASELAHITCGYALKVGASRVRIVTCSEQIWTRLEGEAITDLLFRRCHAKEVPGEAFPEQLPA